MIARVNPSNANGVEASDSARSGAAFRMRSTGRGIPITPVEQTTTCCGLQPRSSPIRLAVARDATMPLGPTEHLAFPELTMTARIAPAEARTCSRERTTGGACTKFCVNTAAADAAGSETIKATSRVPVCPRFLRPQDAEAKRNPRGRARAVGSSLIFQVTLKFSVLLSSTATLGWALLLTFAKTAQPRAAVLLKSSRDRELLCRSVQDRQQIAVATHHGDRGDERALAFFGASYAIALDLFGHGLPRAGRESVAREKFRPVRHGKQARDLATPRGVHRGFHQT